MILANQAKWRCKMAAKACILVKTAELTDFAGIPAHGLWGQAKFQKADSAPFAALVSQS